MSVACLKNWEFRVMLRGMADVLCVGMNDAAMITRKLILERAGHAVIQARDVRKVTEACEATSFSVVVWSARDLTEAQKMRVSDIVRPFCETAKILELHSTILQEFARRRRHLQVTAIEPEGLVEAVNAPLKVSRKTKGPAGCLADAHLAFRAGSHHRESNADGACWRDNI